jgi:hypothetical protein
MTRLCVAQTYAETRNPPQPAEHCDAETEVGFDFCIDHLHLDDRAWDDSDSDDWPFV